MGLIYLSFDTQAMLNYLHKYCKKVELTSSGSGWILYVLSDELGEYEKTGSLSACVIQAFKPFVDRAKADRAKTKSLLDLVTSK